MGIMSKHPLSLSSSPLEQAIDRHPLTVSPETSVADVLRLMRPLHIICTLPADQTFSMPSEPAESFLQDEVKASCVLVIDHPGGDHTPGTLVGIFTERDIVRLIALEILESTNQATLERMPIIEVIADSVITVSESEEQDVFATLSLFRQYRMRHLPIVDANRQLVGVLIRERIRQILQPSNVFRLRRVAELMTTPITAPSDTTLLDLAKLMSKHEASCVVITEQEEVKVKNPKTNYTSVLHYSFQRPIGMITEYDLMLAQMANLDFKTTLAVPVMNRPTLVLKPSDSLWIAHKEMERQRVQRLLVCGNRGELLGLVTQTSLLRVLDPTEMYRAVKQLQQSVYQLQAEKLELLQSRNAELEQLVQERTAKLHEQLERERLLATIALRIHQSLNLNEILGAAVAEVQQFLQVDRVVIYRLEANQRGTVVSESVASTWQSILGDWIDAEFVIEHIQKTKTRPIYTVSDIRQAKLSPTSRQVLEALKVQAYLIVSIVQDDKLWGMMGVHQCSDVRIWQPSETDLLQQLATQVAIAIQQAQLYAQVQSLNADLERQVQERTAELEQKVQELQQLNILKDDFLSTVSHELRTPLTNMKMAIHMLKVAPTPEKLPRYLDILDAECARETEMINALLDLQRLEAASSAVELEPVNLSRWLPTVIEPFRSRAHNRQQVLQVEIPTELPIINSNRANLSRIVAELLNNACKYTPNGGEIVVTVNYQEVPTTLLQLLVSNQAEIPKAALPRIFEKFYRVPNSDPWKQGGTGLGLALVQKLVERLGGTIAVRTAEGWTTFTVELSTEITFLVENQLDLDADDVPEV